MITNHWIVVLLFLGTTLLSLGADAWVTPSGPCLSLSTTMSHHFAPQNKGGCHTTMIRSTSSSLEMVSSTLPQARRLADEMSRQGLEQVMDAPSPTTTTTTEHNGRLDLAAVTEYISSISQQQEPQTSWTSSISDYCMPVVSTALLITANEFGAGSLVLPQLVQGPGLALSSGVFIGAYFVNLLSGIVLAEVAIRQKESSDSSHDTSAAAASSLKEIVETNLHSPLLANTVSIISISVNALVIAFDLSRTGILAHQMTGVLDASAMSMLWAAILATLLGTQSSQRISNIASVCVTFLFLSFGSLLLPGLAQTDASFAWTQPGLAVNDHWWTTLGHVAPIILMSLTFQNVVPTVTRIHNYDRTKTVASMVLGSLIPLVMYVAWCVACLGGGIDLEGLHSAGGPLLAVFSLSALAGSSIGCGLSCASEMKNFIQTSNAPGEDEALSCNTTELSLSTACVTIALPLSLALAVASWGNGDLTPALSVAGGLGSPLLYGILPVGLACNDINDAHQTMMVPMSSLGILGVVTGALFGSNVMEQLCHLSQLVMATVG